MTFIKTKLAALGFLVCSGFAVFADAPVPQFSVSGMGTVAQAPDMATITLGVTVNEPTAAAALRQMREGSAAVFASLERFEIAPRDLQTSQLQVSPQWERYKIRSSGSEGQRIASYLASNLLTVRVRDLAQLGEILDAVGESGANRFEGLSFGFAEPGPLMDQAREAAIKDALRKAQIMAEATGVRLGRVLTMQEHSSEQRPQMLQAESFSRAAIPVASGEVSLSASFTITYELLRD
ncbi:MAG: SIMPL domain-containing protein [Pseudomonadota bacterium]